MNQSELRCEGVPVRSVCSVVLFPEGDTTLIGRLKKKPFIGRGEQEVVGYAEVMDAVFDSHASIPLTENYIKRQGKGRGAWYGLPPAQ